MKILFLLAPIVLLASCTLGNTPVVTSPTPQKPVQTVTPNDAMMKTDSPVMKKEDAMKKEDSMMKSDSPVMIKEDMMKKDDAMMKVDSPTIKKDDAMMKREEAKVVGQTGYIDYSEATAKTALAVGQKVVLFFHAPWCPSCRNLGEEITGNLTAIPANTLILKVDYDSSTELKAKYGVRSQHTTVIIDKDGNLISKKQGAQNIEEILD